MDRIVLNGHNLTIKDVVRVAREGVQVEVAQESRDEINRVRAYVEENWIREDAPATYGFNTGLGKLKDFTITMEQNDEFQKRAIFSHAACVGVPLSEDVVRAGMLVRINALCQGVSGLRMQTLDRLVEMLNKGVHPVIPSQGSVGACGDLGPLSHMVAVLMGHYEAEAYYQGERMSAPEALERAGITPIEYQLKAKDALALINGTTIFTGMAALNCYDAEQLIKQSEIVSALSLEAMRGEQAAFDPRIQTVRKHNGQVKTADNVRRLIKGTQRATEECRKVHLKNDIMHPVYQPRVQDLYSLRCVPQVNGACRDNLDYVKRTLEEEINAATDNPLVFWDETGEKLEFLSGGNFHGEPVAFAMDILAMSLAEIGNISERRSFSICDPTLSYGLPPMLSGEPHGLNCGYPVITCSAAALASENKTLCFPASADSIPTKSNQEDHVSMAPWACRKTKQIIDNLYKLLGIEYLAAARAIWITQDVLGEFQLGEGTKVAYQLLVDNVPYEKDDVYLQRQCVPAIRMTEEGTILKAVEEALGIEL